jgi:hypothetical protein
MTLEELFSSRDSFNGFVYTPWEEALDEIARRDSDPDLRSYVEKILPQGVPPIMEGKKSMVLFRHVATPNYEVNRFVMAADSLHQLQPLILEYTADKFNNRNEWKYFLGKMAFYKGTAHDGTNIFENQVIIDFNACSNQPLHSLATHWGQNLVEFHHGLFENAFPTLKGSVHDVSAWLHTTGTSAAEYYKAFLSLFLRDAILFENFMIDTKEYNFTKDVIMPAFLELYEESGVKPLIVALEPTHLESDQFWMAHPFERKHHIDSLREGAK